MRLFILTLPIALVGKWDEDNAESGNEIKP